MRNPPTRSALVMSKQSLRARYLGIPIAPPKASTLPEDVQRVIVQIREMLEDIREYKHERPSTDEYRGPVARQHNPDCQNLADDAIELMDANREFVLIMQRHAEDVERRWRERMRS